MRMQAACAAAYILVVAAAFLFCWLNDPGDDTPPADDAPYVFGEVDV